MPGVSIVISAGPVKTTSQIAYDAVNKSVMNDWISFTKTTVTPAGVIPNDYQLNHLISWQTNLAPAAGA